MCAKGRVGTCCTLHFLLHENSGSSKILATKLDLLPPEREMRHGAMMILMLKLDAWYWVCPHETEPRNHLALDVWVSGQEKRAGMKYRHFP